MFQNSYRSRSNVKKTFCWVGFDNADKLRKPVKDMNKCGIREEYEIENNVV